MELCLKARVELQKLYTSWDDFHENYLVGYCFWAKEDVDIEYTDANTRKKIYMLGKEFKSNPWGVAWGTSFGLG